MSKKLLIVISSVRPNRLADKVLAEVQSELNNYPDFETDVADFRASPLPFFDGSSSTSAPDFKATDDNVIKWTTQVEEADALLILSAEYNHSYTAVLKNAIDWIPAAIFEGKPVGFVGYGWAGGSRANEKTRILLTEFIKAIPTEAEGNLRFKQEIELDGTILDAQGTSLAIRMALDALK